MQAVSVAREHMCRMSLWKLLWAREMAQSDGSGGKSTMLRHKDLCSKPHKMAILLPVTVCRSACWPLGSMGDMSQRVRH